MTDRTAYEHLLPIPMSMATGAVHHALVKAGLRTKVGLALEAGDCRDVHHAAVLIGYGAGCVCPWVALQTARTIAPEDGEARLLKTLDGGLAKVMSKMGISVLDSYRAAQLFDVLGLDKEITDLCFPGTESPIGGQDLADIEAAIRAAWTAEPDGADLPDYGWVRFRRADRSEPHTWQPQRTRDLQVAVGAARANTQAAVALAPADAWSAYARAVDQREPAVLRDLLQVSAAGPKLELAEVEPPSSLVKRFIASAM
jgi:glutamate synthase (NADPH/NADH) large chain